MKKDIKIISVGGSIIVPESKPNTEFLTKFIRMCVSWLNTGDDRGLILITGGGATARNYQAAFHEVSEHKGILADAVTKHTNELEAEFADQLGIIATRMNGALLRFLFGAQAPEPIVTNPMEAPEEWQGRVLVAAGWKPGFSTDNDAVLLAEKYGAKTVINLSNIKQVYTDDPRKNPEAVPLDKISWSDFRAMVGDEWRPGLNAPFDPIASRKAEEMKLTVICADGNDIPNTRAILNGDSFVGTTISG